ncbi:MAG: hypothetical protein QOJ16_4438 [Acidobacteriota bacterium]|jgi:hypothetical protein|nr:hypothetical protein [Acidobacteriota bacterium]
MSAPKKSLIPATALLVTAAALAWSLGWLPANVVNVANAANAAPQTAAPAAAAAAPLCNLSAPPNLGTITKAIAPNGNAFVSDYNLLSQASWCTFIALNWPAQGTAPTMNADPSQKFGTSGATEVWETWQDSTDVYCANGMPPGQCGATLKAAGSQKVHRLKTANPNTSHFFPDVKLKGFKSQGNKKSLRSLATAAAAGDDQDLSENVQATGFMLPDKNNTPANPSIILYEVRENPSFVGFLNQWGIYNRNGQTALYNQQGGQPKPPGQTPLDFPPSAFEVKPGWYVIPSGEQDPMYVSQGACSPGVQCSSSGTFPIGLTSFHVLWKVFPKSSWIWMTFEYNNNPALTPILSQQVCYTRPGGASCPNTAATCNSGKSCQDGPYLPSGPLPADPVQNAANAANAIFQPMLAGTPFANYKLVGVQMAFMLNGKPTLLANNHVETDFGATNTLTNPTSSCITCHYYASTGNLNTKNCPSKAANIRRIGIFQTTNTIPNMQAFGTGYTGNGQPSLYNQTGTGSSAVGPYMGNDFVWTTQLAQWNLAQGNGCPTSATKSKTPGAVKAKAAKKPAKPATGR